MPYQFQHSDFTFQRTPCLYRNQLQHRSLYKFQGKEDDVIIVDFVAAKDIQAASPGIST